MKLLFFVIGFLLVSIRACAQLKGQDGKIYKTVRIGNQTWMAENLDVSTYRNGDTIPQVQDAKIWSDLKTGAWCFYVGKAEMGLGYGKLYNWYAVSDPRGLAPAGWHIPNDAEWNTLANVLGGKIGSSSKIKSSQGWAKNGNGTNETGFAALPGGTRSVNLFSFAGNYGYWWTSSEYDSYSAWNRFLSYNNDDIGRSTGWKQFGNSVRCIKDDENNMAPVENVSFKIQDTVKRDTIALLSTQIANLDLIKIGEQIWTSQNLDVCTFQNGDSIPEARSDSAWKIAGKLKQPAWCYYNNDTSNEKKYGKLYNWYALTDKRGLAPVGWHIPTESEWSRLINEVSSDKGGEKIKSEEGWKDKSNGTNTTGFTGRPGGFRAGDGQFFNVTVGGYWWTQTESSPGSAWYHSATYFTDLLNSENSGDKEKGLSVRCIKD